MNREEAVLRELNLYPLWKARMQPGVVPGPSVEQADESSVVQTAEAPVAVARADVAVAEKSREQSISELGWTELKAAVRDCTACKLRAGCTQTVFGVGDEKADWLFVGEGPGADEDAQGEPFVGQAGKLLDNMLMAIKLKRGRNVYIGNIVKCRPPGNRNPEADEIAACLPYLKRQIELIQPKIIVALGKTAANALLGEDATLASLRGRMHDFDVAPAFGEGDMPGEEGRRLSPLPHQSASPHRVGTTIPLIITYHPAYLLRTPADKAKAWQDLCLAVTTMEG